RKIVVIESDDWGSVRMPNKRVYNSLIKKGLGIDKNPYTTYDTLANEEDLNSLFDTLKKYTDSRGKNPVITANIVMANPDFDKIRESGFEKYKYECFLETLSKYYPNQDIFSLWNDGIQSKLFFPQFHGREHVNVFH